jgi:hypothetical protein
MSCNSLRTNLVAEKSYGVSGIMGYQSYGIRGLRLYILRILVSCCRTPRTEIHDSYEVKLRFVVEFGIICISRGCVTNLLGE